MTLDDWRRQQNLTLEALGARLGISNQAVSRYCRGRVPQPEIVLRIYKITCGAVEPNDLYDLPELQGSEARDQGSDLPSDALVASGVEP